MAAIGAQAGDDSNRGRSFVGPHSRTATLARALLAGMLLGLMPVKASLAAGVEGASNRGDTNDPDHGPELFRANRRSRRPVDRLARRRKPPGGRERNRGSVRRTY